MKKVILFALSLILSFSPLQGLKTSSSFLAPFTAAESVDRFFPALPGVEPKPLPDDKRKFFFDQVKNFPTSEYNHEEILRARQALLDIVTLEEVLGGLLEYLSEEKMNNAQFRLLSQNFIQMGGEKSFYFLIKGLHDQNSSLFSASFKKIFEKLNQQKTYFSQLFQGIDLLLRGRTKHETEVLLVENLSPKTIYLARDYFLSVFENRAFDYAIRSYAVDIYTDLVIENEEDETYVLKMIQYLKNPLFEDEINHKFKSSLSSHVHYYLKKYVQLAHEKRVNVFEQYDSYQDLKLNHLEQLFENKEIVNQIMTLFVRRDRMQLRLLDFLKSPFVNIDGEEGLSEPQILILIKTFEELKTKMSEANFFWLIDKWGLTQLILAFEIMSDSNQQFGLDALVQITQFAKESEEKEFPFTDKLPSYVVPQSSVILAKMVTGLYKQGGLEAIEKVAPLLIASPNVMDGVKVQQFLIEMARNPKLVAPLVPWMSSTLQLRTIPLSDKSWIQIGLSYLLYQPESWEHPYWMRRLILDTPYSRRYDHLHESRKLAKLLDEQMTSSEVWKDFIHWLRQKVHFYAESNDPERFHAVYETFKRLQGKPLNENSFAPLRDWIPSAKLGDLYHRLKETGQDKLFSPPSLGDFLTIAKALEKRYEKISDERDSDIAVLLKASKWSEALKMLFSKRDKVLSELKEKSSVLDPSFGRYDHRIMSLDDVYKEKKLTLFEKELQLKMQTDSVLEDVVAQTEASETDLRELLLFLIEQLDRSGLATWRLNQLRNVLEKEDLILVQRQEVARYIRKEVLKIYDFFNQQYKGKVSALAAKLPKKTLQKRFRNENNLQIIEEELIAGLMAEEPAIGLIEKALAQYTALEPKEADSFFESDFAHPEAVFFSSEKDDSLASISAALFGTKAANLAALSQKGFPIPPGFVLSAKSGSFYNTNAFRMMVLDKVLKLEKVSNRYFSFDFGRLRPQEMIKVKKTRAQWGPPEEEPLRVSVRSGSFVSMPGFLDSLMDIKNFDDLIDKINYVYDSWTHPKAQAYREKNNISDLWRTGVLVQQMVHGDKGETSGTGVLFSHDLTTQALHVNGEYQAKTSGEVLVGGKATKAIPLRPQPGKESSLEGSNPVLFKQIQQLSEELTQFAGAPIEAEFTIENGELYLLQMRSVSLVQAGSVLDPKEGAELIAVGEGASGGAIQARFVFEEKGALNTLKAVERLEEEMAIAGEKDLGIILVSEYVTPETARVLLSPKVGGVLTSAAVASAHATLVARQEGKVLISVPPSKMKRNNGSLYLNGHAFNEGRNGPILSLDGNLRGNSDTAGHVYLGIVPIQVSKENLSSSPTSGPNEFSKENEVVGFSL